MSLTSRLIAAAAAVLFAAPVLAGDIRVDDPYARVSARMGAGP